MKKLLVTVIIVTIGIYCTASIVWAEDLQDQKFQFGIRDGVFLADGEPANDLPMYGIYGRFNWTKKWHLGLSLDYLSGDFERPYRLLGIESAEELDSDMTNIIISVWGEREFVPASEKLKKLRPYIASGLGIGLLDVDDAKGVVDGGGRYDIKTDAGTEYIPAMALGLRYLLGKSWEADISGRYSYHITDWKVTDRLSGKVSSIDNYSTYGIYFGVGFRF